METARGALGAWEAGILADLAAAGVMTTDQLRRLRFPGTGRANCRSHLARLRRQGLIERLEPRLTPVREACWRLTASGAASIGRPVRVPAREGRALHPAAVGRLLLASESYVGEQTAARLDPFGEADGPDEQPDA